MKINGCHVFFLFVLPLFLFLGFGLVCSSSESSGVLGGIDNYSGNQIDAEIESIGRFSVQEYNNKENALLEFKRIIKAQEQVVSGTLYYLTLEVVDAGKKKIYEAKVWVKPWMNFKKLEEFRHANDLSSFSSDDDAKKDAGH